MAMRIRCVDGLRVDECWAGTAQLSGSSDSMLVLAYQPDLSGQVTRIRDNRNSGQYECYGYDTNSRLTTAMTADSTCSTYSATGYAPFDHAYTYDNLHNLTSLDGPGYTYGTGNTSASGDAGPHAVTDIGTTIDFGYDNNGNRITKTQSGATTTYTYNPENRLAAVDLPSDSNDVTFVYDADGNRVKRTHGTYSTTYVAGLMEIDRTGSTVTQTRTFYGLAGLPVAVRTHVNPATTFVFQNHLGSTVTAWDDTANTHIRQYYYPYGAERHAVGSLPLDQRYTGQTSDATTNASGGTGLLYYIARYYDPTVGAFTAADTLIPTTELSVGLNRYAYVNDNPANNTDPTGNTTIQLDPCLTGDSDDAGDGTVTVAGVAVQFMNPSPSAPDGNPQLQYWRMYNDMYGDQGIEWGVDAEDAIDRLKGPALVGSTLSHSNHPVLRGVGNASSRLSTALTVLDVVRSCATASATCGENANNAVLSTLVSGAVGMATSSGFLAAVALWGSTYLLGSGYPELDGGGYSTPQREWFWGGPGGHPVQGGGGGFGGWQR
jgi:RHS repeat-associated protein